MKKLAFALLVTVAVVGCKKENVATPTLQESDALTNQKQVEELILRADKDLHAQLYDHTHKMPHVGIKELKGVYVWTTDVASGTCFPHPTCVCMVIVSPLEKPDSTEIENIIPDVLYTFAPEQAAELIINAQEPFVVDSLTAFRTQKHEEGFTSFSYTH